MGRIRAERRLKAKDIATLPPGLHEDGGGLRLLVKPSGSRSWLLRLTIAGKPRAHRGLGSYPVVTLDAARARAMEHRRAAKEGRNLAQERRQQQARQTTFKEAFEATFAQRRESFTNARHAKQWETSMRDYVLPKLGHRPVGEIGHADVLEVLQPIWHAKPVTSRRLLQRLESVFKSATLRGWRVTVSPCVGILDALGARQGQVRHHPALPHADVGRFISALRAFPARSSAPLALEFAILTAARSGAVRFATWDEIDLDAALWTVPNEPGRKRGGVIPLSSGALAALHQARAASPRSQLVFPGTKAGQPLSHMVLLMLMKRLGLDAVPHGFRSAFRDWAAESGARDEVSESALLHAVQGRVRQAYLRTDLMQARRELMERWSAYCLEISR